MDNDLLLYSNPDAKLEELKKGFVLDIAVPPPELAKDSVHLLVVTDPTLLQKSWKVAQEIVKLYVFFPVADEDLQRFGITALTINDVPPEQRPLWEKEINTIKYNASIRRDRGW